MSYKIKEMFYTLQGEGGQAGRPAVFCRFSGCNLWTGREEDRHKAVCQFCDTDFWGTDGVNGGRFETAQELAQKIKSLWHSVSNGVEKNASRARPYVVCTGGEPALQMDKKLVDALHTEGFEIAIETNGTVDLPDDIDWICVSPKAHTELKILRGNELKLVFPQRNAEPERFTHLDFDNFYLQPMDSPFQKENIRAAVTYCLSNPQWKLSLQTHKILEIP